jgi:SAM-dependent methyltransferase
MRQGIRRAIRILPAQDLEYAVTDIVKDRMAQLPADDALRFWFRITAEVYPLLGQRAVDYGGGVHPKHRHTRYHDFFVNRIRMGERVLDIGCGIGAVAYDIAERSNARVIGIDVSSKSIAVARERYHHPNLAFDVHDGTQPLPGGSFEVVVLSNILEHLPERATFLRRVQKAATPSRILIRVPLFERDWQVPLKKELGVEWRLDATHETEYTLESFAEELAMSGLRVLHQEVRWGEIWAEVTADAA